MKKRLATAIAFGACLVLPIAWSLPAGASGPRHTITGFVQLVDTTDNPFYQTPCDGSASAGLNDLSAGTSVTVKNGSGKIIAVGEIRGGKASSDGSTCTMPFKVKGVPEVGFYEVTAANRGGLTYSLGQMKRSHWKVSASIGS